VSSLSRKAKMWRATCVNSKCKATLDDVESMVKLEASWNYRQLPPNALSETGALFIPLGTTGLTRVLSDKDSRILVVKRTGKLQGMVVACRKQN